MALLREQAAPVVGNLPIHWVYTHLVTWCIVDP